MSEPRPFIADRLLTTIRARPLVVDAGMGSRLLAAGLDRSHDDPCLWNLSHPDIVESVHREDVAAGADVLVTNTFGANHNWLARYGRGRPGDLTEINRRGFELAKTAAGSDRFVVGSIGPTLAVNSSKPGGQIKSLLVSGVDALLLETFEFAPALVVLETIRIRTVVPILVSLFRWPDRIGDASRSLQDAGADVLGINCVAGMSAALDVVRRLRDATDLPILAMPSGSQPEDPSESPESFGNAVPELLRHNVRLIGGCCGTTSAHVAAIRRALDSSTVH